MPHNRRPHRTGFSLVELLVVVAIVVILIALLFPSFKGAKAKALDLSCRKNLRTIGTALITHASDTEGALPGLAHQYAGPEPHQRAWLGAEVLEPGERIHGAWPQNDANGVPERGVLVPYLGIGGIADARSKFRCPAVKEAPLFSAAGSNGRFDYALLLMFMGARFNTIPMKSEVAMGTHRANVFTPLVVEEDYYWWTNRQPNIEPGHGNIDRLGNWHSGGGNYLTTDGSVHQLIMPGGIQPFTNDWYTDYRGVRHRLGRPYGFAGWNK